MNSVSIPRRPCSRARWARWAGSGLAIGGRTLPAMAREPRPRAREGPARTAATVVPRPDCGYLAATVTQSHLDRLSAIDAGFLAQERPNTHMHIGGLVLLDGPPPPIEDFLAHVRSRL